MRFVFTVHIRLSLILSVFFLHHIFPVIRTVSQGNSRTISFSGQFWPLSCRSPTIEIQRLRLDVRKFTQVLVVPEQAAMCVATIPILQVHLSLLAVSMAPPPPFPFPLSFPADAVQVFTNFSLGFWDFALSNISGQRVRVRVVCWATLVGAGFVSGVKQVLGVFALD